MTGKHVQPVREGETQPKRSGLAVGLTILTALLCVAVLFLSARRHRDQAIREQIEERLVAYAGYEAAGQPLRLEPEAEAPLDPPRVVGPVLLRPPSDAWQLGEQVVKIGERRYHVDAVANASFRAEFLRPIDGEWDAGLAEAIDRSALLEPPRRTHDRALVEYLFSVGVGTVREHVARSRQPVMLAQRAYERLRVRCESPQLGQGQWRQPHAVTLPNFRGWVDLATEERPIVSVLIFEGNEVIAEAVVSRTDGRGDGVSVEELNRRWWTMLAGVQGPAPASDRTELTMER